MSYVTTMVKDTIGYLGPEEVSLCSKLIKNINKVMFSIYNKPQLI